MTIKDRRRALMGAQSVSSARIPKEYQEVYWISSSTSAYLATGIVPKIAPKLETQIKNNDSTTKKRPIFYLSTNPTGHTTSPLAFALTKGQASSAALIFAYGTVASTNYSFSAIMQNPSDWVTISVSNKLIANGTTLGTKAVADFSDNIAEIVLGTRSDNGSNIAFKQVTIWDGTDMVADLVPCYRKSDSKIGMYCLVRETFYPGTGTYYKGADVV